MSNANWPESDRRHAWHPYTQHATAPAPVPIVRAEGAYLHDIDGRAIFDAISSWWVTLHGHSHPAIAEAIGRQARQLEQVIFAGFTHEPAARLAAELVARLPRGLERIFYSDNGSTAVEVALKMALQYWSNRGEQRPLVAALDQAYHGDTFGAMSASGRGLFTAPFEHHLFDVARLGLEDPAGDLEQLLATRGRALAAVIVEPMLLGAGGMLMWDAAALRRIRELTKREGILLIADEVLTGFGRTGPLFACNHADVVPDLMCLSKGLTGGFLPLGITAATERVFGMFLDDDRRRTLFHGHSFTANPIACAAARASLALIDADCDQRREGIEAAHRAGLSRIASHPAVTKPRVLGTVAAFDLATQGSYLDPIGTRLAAKALAGGILLRPLGNVGYILPPYCTTPAELATVYDLLVRFLEDEI